MKPLSENNLLNTLPYTYTRTSAEVPAESCKTQISEQNSDTLRLSTKTDEDKKKKYKKYGIATGILLGITAIGLIIRGRLKAVTKLAEHIDFTPAKTMEEAKEFAKTHLKISKFDTAGDLDMANWVNEGLVNINNKYKGRAHIPNEVRPVPPEQKEQYKNIIASMMTTEDEFFNMRSRLTVNVDYFNNVKNSIDETMRNCRIKIEPQPGTDKSEVRMLLFPFYNFDKQMDIMTLAGKYSAGKASKMELVMFRKSLSDYVAYAKMLNDNPLAILKDIYKQKNIVETLKQKMPANSFKSVDELAKMTKKEQREYIDSAYKCFDSVSYEQKPYSSILSSKRSLWDTLYHEEGHLFHHKNSILSYNEMDVVYDDVTRKPIKTGIEAKEFLNSEEEQLIAATVSNYAKSSPLEFVAEVYARMLNGQKFGDDVMKLYEKYHGPKLPV